MLLNQELTGNEIHTLNGTSLNTVDDFQYLGSYIKDSKNDFNIHKALAWSACNKLQWKSNISKDTKLAFFQALVESILIYGAETWTMKKDLEKRLGSVCKRLLVRAQNLSWKICLTLGGIYENITLISRRLASRRHQYVGHCFCGKSQIISDLILWKLPSHRKEKRPLNYIDAVSHENNIGYEELPAAMSDRTYWRNFVVDTHLG